MRRIWLDPRNGGWWEVFLHEGRGSFPRLLVFLSEEGDVLAASLDGAPALPERLDDRQLCRLLDRARDALVRSAVRQAVSDDGAREADGARTGPGGGRSVA